jgi:hypothetical protein
MELNQASCKIPALSLTGSVTLGTLHYLSKSHVFELKNGEANQIHLMGLLLGLNKITYLKCLADVWHKIIHSLFY